MAYEEGAGGSDQDIAVGFVSTIAVRGGELFGFMRVPVFLGDGSDDGHGGGVGVVCLNGKGSCSGDSGLDHSQFASCTVPYLSSHCLRSRRLHKSRLLSVQRAQFHRMCNRYSLLPPWFSHSTS